MNYESVPNIITGKDLDYLSDMFNWNYGSYKCTVNAIDKVNDEEIRNLLVSATDMFYEKICNIPYFLCLYRRFQR